MNNPEMELLVRSCFLRAKVPGAVFHLVSASGPVLTVEHGELSADTQVMLGSTSKMFTSTLLLQLADEGLLALADPLTKHLPDSGAPTDVTLDDLAHHMSGLRADARPGHLTFRSHRGFTYANQNYNLLGDVITAVTGTSFERAVTTRLFTPLGMRRSGCAPTTYGARGRTSLFGLDLPAPRGDFGAGSWIQGPSGGIVSTAQDAGLFLSMLLGRGALNKRRILSEHAVETMLSAVVPADNSPAVSSSFGPDGEYALGWVRKDVDGHAMFFHTGKVPHATSIFVLLPDLGLAFVLMANLGDLLVRTPILEDAAAELIRLLLGVEPAEGLGQVSVRSRQALINLVYVGFLAVSAAGWVPLTRRSRGLGRDGAILYHAVAPSVLLAAARHLSGAPWPWLIRFAPDAASVLLAGCLSMQASGGTRMVRSFFRNRRHPS